MPKNKPSIIKIPKMNYIAVRGKGNPNDENGEYKQTIGLLYAIAFIIKMSYKGTHKIDGYFEYVVPPLEGFWWQDGVKDSIDYNNKDQMNFISIIRLPEFVTKEDFDWAIKEANNKKKGIIMEFIEAKTILQRATHGEEWFGIDYNMNLYKGCCHKCIYCDSRSNCYQVEDFDKVRAKKDEIEILNRELKTKRKKGVIGIGAMSDTYNPFEKQYEITRQALELILSYNFGVSIETKSNLIVRDIDIFKEINKKADIILKFTITSADDSLSRKVEPGVCVSSERLKAMKQLAKEGLFVGTLLTPIIPFITDSENNIRNVIRLSYENGAKFIFSMGGVTLRENQRVYFFEQLDKTFPNLKEKYIKTYGNNYFCYPLNKNLGKIFKEECEKYGLLYKMSDIVKAYKKEIKQEEQLTFI